jgi:uncharacterized protein
MSHIRERNRRHIIKKIPLAGLFFVILFLPALIQAQGLNFPQTNVPINDFADIISPEYETKMDALARAVWEKTGTALVVATFRDVGGENPRIFATKLYSAWGIGAKGVHKGILLLVAVKERQVTFETGYGAEGILPDAKMGAILDQYVVPLLLQDRYGEGLLNGMGAVAAILAKDAGVRINVRDYGAKVPQARRGIGLVPLAFFILLVIFSFFGRRRGISPVFLLPWLFLGGGRGIGGFGGGLGGFSGGFGGFGGGMSGGGGASRSF